MNLRKIRVLNKHSDPIASDIRFPDGSKKSPAVIIIHGFKGNKEWGFFPYISEKIALSGAITFCFNFSLNGFEDGGELIQKPNDFARNTISREIEDLLAIINSIKNEFNQDLSEYWNGEIYLLGHSLGGAISLVASQFSDSIDKIAIWGSISTFERYTRHQKELWQKTGFYEFLVTKTGQILRMNLDYLGDIENHKDEYDILKAAASFAKPLLIVHGLQDMTVPVREAKLIYNSAVNEMTELLIIPKTGHTFGVEHPFTVTSESLETALNKTISFFGLL